MAENEINPYTAPATGAGDGPGEGLWQVSGDVLLFRDGARLPQVDVFSGRDDLELTPASGEFLMMPPSVALMRAIPMGVVFALILMEKIDILSGLLVILLFSVAMRFARLKGVRRARLKWFVDRDTALERRRSDFIRATVSWVALGFFITAVLFGGETLMLIALLVVCANFVYALVLSRKRPGLRCLRETDGWFEVHGLPREALRALAAHHRADAGDEAPEPQVRRVFTYLGYRSRLADLAGDRWMNPLLLLNLLILKIGRSRILTREMLHWSEARDLKGSGWDPTLRRRWDQIQSSGQLAGWRLLHARQLDSLTGDSLAQWFVLVDPEGRHSMTVAVVRIANALTTLELLETTLRSWDIDGMVWVTTNRRDQRPRPPTLQVLRVAGTDETILATHLARVADLEIVPADTLDEWNERMENEQAMRHAALEQAGIYGPTREESVVVPGDGVGPARDGG